MEHLATIALIHVLKPATGRYATSRQVTVLVVPQDIRVQCVVRVFLTLFLFNVSVFNIFEGAG